MRPINQCTALLFDGSHANAVSRLFTCASQAWTVWGTEPDAKNQLHQTLNQLDTLSRNGVHIVISLAYEAYSAFSAADHLTTLSKPSQTPWLQALAFEPPQKLNREQALNWLKQQSHQATTHLTPSQPSISQADFIKHIETIRDLIAAGDTYQVNYTFPLYSELLAHADGDQALAAVYHQLVQNLKIPYGAFLTLPHNSLLSFSPELFVEMSPTALTCRPMKGTAAIADNDTENTRRAAVLATDPKNRAENLMIVDLMRNDLSRLKQVQKVSVPKLFEVKRYGAVLQMTSTVKAHIDEQPSLIELLDALFPCGSITGAPKHRTLEIIDTLEPHARGAYCGAIGFIEPLDNQRINARFSVSIRTIETLCEPQIDTLGIQHWPLKLSVGAGITYDSNPQDEWQESLLKAKFLTQYGQAFELIETMRVDLTQPRIKLLHQHFNRLCASAQQLDWPTPDYAAYEHVIFNELSNHAINQTWRLRLTFNARSTYSVTISPFEPIHTPAIFAIYPIHIQSSNPFLRHKTTARALYNQALAQAKTHGLFDYIFLNEKNELTEGARSSIFIKIKGEWYTTPIDSGILAGIQRAELIGQLQAQERPLNIKDLKNAEEVLLCNALYGAVKTKKLSF